MLYVALALVAIACGAKENPEGNSGSGTSSTVAPKQPTGLKVLESKITETTLTFQWDLQSGVKFSYTLTQGSATVKEGTTSNRNVKLDGLTKGTTYKFTVYAVAGEQKSAGATVEARTAGEEDPVDPGTDPGDTKIAYEEFGIPAAEEDGVARAFPGAEGGGMYATGGRGGKILHVTTLEDSNAEGTLRWACTQNYPRIIVFDVAGTIALKSQLQINRDNCTIAGQTAPGDGICLKNYTFRISASNVIVRFIRCRMGDEEKTEDDAIQVMSHGDKENPDKYHDIIIDHCSVSWSTDECASFYGMKDFTFSWNIVSESLRASVHGKGNHGYGGIWGGNNATYHHNLLAHHDSRNPRIDHDYVCIQKGPVTISNNVVYNWSGNTCYGGESINNTNTSRQYNFVNNYYKPGPATPSSHLWLLEPTVSCSNCSGLGYYPNDDKSYKESATNKVPTGSTIVPGRFYVAGNTLDGKNDVTSNNWKAGTSSGVGVYISSSDAAKIKANSPYECNPMSLHSANDAFTVVTTYAGASFAKDAIDARVQQETINGKATYNGSNGSKNGLIDTQTDVADASWKNGWPVYEASAEELDALRDADADGIPNAVEEAWGLNKSDAKDASAYTLDPDKRYTNLEMYLHYLVKDIVNGGNQKAEYKKL